MRDFGIERRKTILDLAQLGVASYFLRVPVIGGFACLHDLLNV
jgi:hypothetical protein